ncbi:MAG: tRNA (adenosine(37)-N6)-threonylcarbamoyltransferase complex dimerization subunit type 1 TsaB [Lachnospiraceae bacterium]|nr:tRNA (adenosine(37)-N6)-threonylcarbamoyltransferase complex dimerization subunit type 1 TsaB [Lachnospiraceae bacterium]
MKILAIDSSGLVASAAILTEENLIAEYTVNYKKTHSQTLLPMIDEIVRMAEVDLKEIDAIALAEGPGSFTGLRIGSSTAKGLGLALGKPIIGVSTLKALAYNLFGTDSLICPMMDARRGQVYTGLYSFEEGKMVTLIDQTVISAEQMIETACRFEKPVIYLGDGVPVYRGLLEEKTTVPYTFAPAHVSKQRAGAVGALAFEYYKQGKVQTAAEHAPVYLRLSQAERELMEKQAAQPQAAEGAKN